jgi:hypothetical protein
MKIISAASMAFVISVAGTASAHHSYAIYDSTKTVKMTGVVKAYRWGNPHVMLEFVPLNSSGPDAAWEIELQSVNIISRKGWSNKSLAPGDKVEVVLHPAKNNQKMASLVSVTTPSGQVLKDKT